MSKLNDLIEELCPEGVEYRKIKECYTRLKGTPITAEKMKEIQSGDGEIKIFAGGKTAINAYEKDIPNANITRVPAVLVQSRGIIDVIYYEKPFTFKNEMWAYTTNEKISVKFLYYVLKNNIHIFRDAASGMGSLPQISLKVTEEFEIPVPPLEVQAEIVRILDKFTHLQELLKTELHLRKKQYEYYRDTLLTFGDKVETINLGNICEIKTGSKPDIISTEKTEYEYINAGTTNSGYSNDYNCDGDTVTTPSRGQGGIGYVGYQKNKFWLGPLCYKLRTKSNQLKNKYLYYFLNANPDLIFQFKNTGGVPSLNAGDVAKIEIKLPYIKTQERIIEILDRFDALCHDLTSGIPAEIAARQKQYEYYRDKLLTFKRKENR